MEEQEVAMSTPFQDMSREHESSRIMITTKSEKEAIDAFMDDKIDSPDKRQAMKIEELKKTNSPTKSKAQSRDISKSVITPGLSDEEIDTQDVILL